MKKLSAVTIIFSLKDIYEELDSEYKYAEKLREAIERMGSRFSSKSESIAILSVQHIINHNKEGYLICGTVFTVFVKGFFNHKLFEEIEDLMKNNGDIETYDIQYHSQG